MNVENKRIRIVAIFSISLFAVGLLAYYFLVIQPLNQQISDQEIQLAAEEDILYSLESSQEEVDDYGEHEITSLLRRVPVHPWVDHWMIDIERLELVSDTSINEFIFSKDILIRPTFASRDEDVEESVELDGNSFGDDHEENDASVELDIENENETVTIEVEETLEDINGITASLTGYAETYENIYDYIAEIEKLERFTEVYSLYFEAPTEEAILMGESEEEEQEHDERILFNVLISTYYMEELIPEFGEFERQGPFISPDNKGTPLFQLP